VFFDELQTMSARNAHIRCHFTVTSPVLEPWTGDIGRIDRSRLTRLFNAGGMTAGSLYFVCGPRGFAEDVEAILGELGADRSRIRREGW
jgi:ferredoxin-NADP reductase